MTRTCACGCGASLDGKRASARYASGACRTAAYKDREGITGYRPVKASQNGRRGGVQVSYRKAVAALAEFLKVLPTDDDTLYAERILLPALSPRARAQVEAAALPTEREGS
jgi:hypothetical protein